MNTIADVQIEEWRGAAALARADARAQTARSEGKALLTLDTWTGRHAESLYQSLGYVTVGVIPRYARGRYRRNSNRDVHVPGSGAGLNRTS